MRRRLVLVALAALVAMPFAARAGAQQTDKQRQLAEEIEETSKAAQQARAAAVEHAADKARYDATLGDLETQLAAAQASLSAAEAEVERLGFESYVLSVDIDETQRKLVAADADAKASALLLYKRPDTASGGVTHLIGSTSGSGELVEAKHYLERVSDKRRKDFARAQRLREELGDQKAELDAQAERADAARADAEATKNRIDAIYAEQNRARNAAAEAQASFEVQAGALAAEQIALEAEKAKEDAAVRALLETVADGPPMGNGQLLRPVGGPITSGFGYRSDPISGASAFHAGIDFGSPCGTPIKAAGNGTIVSAGWQGGYGNATIINHGGGMATLYGHQSSFAVGAGQTVSAGQVIGYVGSTGKSTGCHLHLEVRINGNPVDPRGYL